MIAVLTGSLLGLAGGVRHAFEPDHVSAVSTLVVDQKGSRRAISFALLWGFGHAITLLLVGGVFFFVRKELPETLVDTFELGVCAMLVFLGLRAIHRARLTAHPHVHESLGAGGGRTFSRQPLLVGLVHGLAGSGALTSLVLASFSSPLSGLAFITLYGAGAALSMSVLAGVAFAPIARLAPRPRTIAIFLALTGALSIALGVGAAWPIAKHRFSADALSVLSPGRRQIIVE